SNPAAGGSEQAEQAQSQNEADTSVQHSAEQPSTPAYAITYRTQHGPPGKRQTADVPVPESTTMCQQADTKPDGHTPLFPPDNDAGDLMAATNGGNGKMFLGGTHGLNKQFASELADAGVAVKDLQKAMKKLQKVAQRKPGSVATFQDGDELAAAGVASMTAVASRTSTAVGSAALVIPASSKRAMVYLAAPSGEDHTRPEFIGALRECSHSAVTVVAEYNKQPSHSRIQALRFHLFGGGRNRKPRVTP
ncbi:unnamed protein product, partial [Amoebophrya sp. A25]